MKKWIEKVTDSSGLEKIRASVAEAEARTSCEIVPMIVRRSSLSGHVRMIVFLLLAMILTALLPYIEPSLALPYWLLEVVIICLAAALSPVIAKSEWLQIKFTPTNDLRAHVDRRALIEFFNSDVYQTAGRNGVLIFVSLLEHRAVVLADQTIATKLPASTWDEAVRTLLAKTKAGDFAGGMSAVIKDLGDKLSVHFPLQAGDKNELSDQLVIKD